MIELWVGIALLTVLAIAFVFLPFVRARRLIQNEVAEDREQQNIEIFQERLSELEEEKAAGNLDDTDFATLKTELERNLLSDVNEQKQSKNKIALTSQTLVTVTLLALMIPVAAIGLYSVYGRSADLELSMQQPKDPFNGKQPTLEEAVAQLEKELELNPENPEGWYLLSTTYMNQGRFKEGAAGFEKVVSLLPEDSPQYADVLGQYAQALFFANESKMSPEIKTVIDKTLAIKPLEITVLGLLGIDRYEHKDYQGALDYWLKALRNSDGKTAESLRSGVRNARDALIAEGVDVPEIPELMPASISLKVNIDDQLKQQVAADATVFVFARELGGRIPLAAVKLQVSDLPIDVVLDDSKAMNPQSGLSTVSTVEVSARVSKTGEPKEQPGDLYGLISPVQVRGTTLPMILTIDRVVE
ncbi:c-type cytochrome biogenesis protein CcmI [Neptuniibacter sp. QD29_5]|uniref:c-type cytochrome biogenesis protein CcmI n=1 Tax=Neptuniibacter sp. QD29_5 TaxID=3398207 RepID=UPI0039F51BFF